MTKTALGLMLGAFIALLDMSIVTVALPRIGADLHADTAGLQWVMDAYTVLLSGLILTGGTLGDRYGRKRCYLAGIALLTVGSAGCAVAPTYAALVAARALQGGAGALVMTGALSLLVQAYPEPTKRAEMLGIYSMTAGMSVVLGPVLGGVLVDTVGWRSIFLINLPIGVITILLVTRGIPESSDPDHAALDPIGQLLGLVLLATLTYGVIASRDHDWPVFTPPLLVAALALFLFARWESRADRPMLPVALFRDMRFTIPNIASFVLGFGTSAVFFLLSLYLQQVQGRSPISVGLRFLPLTVAICVTAPIMGRVTGRFGPYRVMVGGYLVSGAALLAIALLGTDTGTARMTVLSLLLGVGMGASISPTQLAGVLALPRERSGLASACIGTTRQSGTAIGIAVLGVIVGSAAGSQVGTPTYASGFVRGLHRAGYISGAATIAAALLVMVLIRPVSVLTTVTNTDKLATVRTRNTRR